MIVVGGESLIDLIAYPGGRLTAIPGGGPFNTARTIGRLGGSAAYLGRLSTDRFGRDLLDRLILDGVDCRLVQSTDDPTTLAVAELDDAGAATYQFYVEGTSAPGLSADGLRRWVAGRHDCAPRRDARASSSSRWEPPSRRWFAASPTTWS